MTLKILITGTAGFIGFHLARLLLAEGFRVHGYDGMTDYYDVTLKQRRHAMLPLQRKGSWLISNQGRWQMHSVHGPLALDLSDREYFRVETACKEVLLVSRQVGERGMRELRLDSVMSTRSEERSSVAS